MDKSEYRSIFKEYSKQNNKVALSPILKELGISTGNFYYFLAHEEDGDKKMSTENLEKIYQEIQTRGGTIPTNRAKLESMETSKMVKELFKRFDFASGNVKPRDVTKWMNSFVGDEFNKKPDKK